VENAGVDKVWKTEKKLLSGIGERRSRRSSYCKCKAASGSTLLASRVDLWS